MTSTLTTLPSSFCKSAHASTTPNLYLPRNFLLLTNKRVVMQKVVQPLCTKRKSSHDFACLYGLAGVGDGSTFHQIHYSIREHFRVDPKVSVFCQLTQYSIRDGANTC